MRRLRYRAVLEMEPDWMGHAFRLRMTVQERGLYDRGDEFHREFMIGDRELFEKGMVEMMLECAIYDFCKFIKAEKQKIEDKNQDPIVLLAEALAEWRKGRE